jgi:hypothetical protein
MDIAKYKWENVKLSLHNIKAYGGVEVQHHTFLISAQDGGYW